MTSITIAIESLGCPTRHVDLGEGTFWVGSSGCDLTLAYPTVSKKHGRLSVAPSSAGVLVEYRDLGSRNGSMLESASAPLPPESSVAWPSGQSLLVGPFTLRWSLKRAPSARKSAGLAELAERYALLINEEPARAREKFIDGLGGSAEAASNWETIHHEFHGNGPLRGLLTDPQCREILINSHDELYADTGAGLVRRNESFLTRNTYEAWAVRTAHHAGRRLDLQNPICEATLPGGARFHAVMPPLSSRGLSVAVRRFGAAPISEETALASDWLSPTALALLKNAVRERRNIVISGGTSTGKTSLLNFICQFLSPLDRIITVEDTVELSPPVENLVQLQARGANADGVGQVTLRQLVQCALRMRPDRIIVGECRGAEVLEMLQALNTGHPGSLTTVHANSTAEAVQRLELLALLGAPNLSVGCIRDWIATSVEVIVQLERDGSGHRHVAAIACSGGRDSKYEVLYERNRREMAADQLRPAGADKP